MAYITSPLFVRDKQNPFLSLARAASSSLSSTMDSPPSEVPRSSLLGSIAFLNRSNRPRNNARGDHTVSPIAEQPNPLFPAPLPPTATVGASGNPRRRTVQPGVSTTTQSASNPLGYMLRRRRSANNVGSERDRERRETSSNPIPRETAQQLPQQPSQAVVSAPTHRIRLVPHLANVRSLHFEAICRDVKQGDPPLRIGRFTEQPGSTSNKLAFKSKVVSRGHAEVWFDNGVFYIKDTKSSSGTFLNHIRLSPPNAESRPFSIKDGDVLQLGVDYQGGTEEIYRCVKMRVELGREWQNGVNAFNSHVLAQLKSLTSPAFPPRRKSKLKSSKASHAAAGGVSVPDCCICLGAVTVCQALFIAPCSHAYHYKCIRPLLLMHHPGFSCPLCGTFADLEADVDEVVPEGSGEESEVEEDGQAREKEGDVEMRDGSAEAEAVVGGELREEGLAYVSVEDGTSAGDANIAHPSTSLVPISSFNTAVPSGNSRGHASATSLNLNTTTPTSTHVAFNTNAPLPPLPPSTNTLPFPSSGATAPHSPFASNLTSTTAAHVLARRSVREVEMQSEQTDAEPDPGSGRFVPWLMASGAGMSEEGEGDGEMMMEGATFLSGMLPPGLGRPTMQEGGVEVDEVGVEGAQTGQNAGKRRRVEDEV